MTIKIDGVDYTAQIPCPISISKTLDESLDTGHFATYPISRQAPFQPFAECVIDGETWLVANDNVTETIGMNRYKHDVLLVEETKRLERYIIGGKTVSNPLIENYANSVDVVQTVQHFEPSFIYPDPIEISQCSSPIIEGTNLSFMSMQSFANAAYNVNDKYLASGTLTIYENDSAVAQTTNTSESLSCTAKSYNTYRAVYDLQRIKNTTTLTTERVMVTYDGIYCQQPAKAHKKHTLADVADSLLATVECRRLSDTVPFSLSTSARSLLSSVDSPEFSFSCGRTLWECLRDVFTIVHAIPRLKGGLIYADMLGGETFADMSKGTVIASDESHSIERFCSGIETNAANLINMEDESQGSICEPFAGGYKTVRAQTDTARVSDDTMMVATTYPIDKIVKVRLGYGDNNTLIGDITPYLFEKHEYDILSSYKGAYPRSKSYALCYTVGNKGITGLNFKPQTVGPAALQHYSIINIIEAVIEESIDTLFTDFDYNSLQFEITYIPHINARIRQERTESTGTMSVLAFNQSADRLSSRSLGEAMRGTLKMWGTTDVKKTALFRHTEDVPAPGTLFDPENYINTVGIEINSTYTRAVLGLSTNFNELGKHLEIPNGIRQYEISENNVNERRVLAEEYCEISETSKNLQSVMLTETARNSIIATIGATVPASPVQMVISETLDSTQQSIAKVMLPVMSLSIGNSLLFAYEYADNFSAGDSTADSGDANQLYRMQSYVPYGDIYGEAKYLKLSMYSGTSLATAKQNHAGAAEVGNALPAIVDGGIANGYEQISTGDYPIILEKDGREHIGVSYQLHFVADAGIIIGAGLAECQGLAKEAGATSAARVYIYNHRINTINGTTDTESAVGNYPLIISTANRSVSSSGWGGNWQSWAVIKDGKFLFGKNTSKQMTTLYFNFLRKRG